jgi:hypothetical protein
MMTSRAKTGSGVDVREEGVHSRRVVSDVGLREARDRFGGLDIPGTLAGMLTALALLVLLAGLIGAAIGTIGYQTGLRDNVDDLSIGALAGGIAAVFVAFLIGGWTAARIARYDGLRNGIMTAVWAIVLAAILAGLGTWLGSEYNVFEQVDLPNWFSHDALTAGAIASGVVSIVAMLAGGALGGLWGERFHRHADATIAATRPGGILRDPGAVR